MTGALPRLFVALDTADPGAAATLARSVGHRAGIKIGLEFFAALGPEGVRRVRQDGQALFLDLKLHDIPNTVAGAVGAAAALSPDLLTVHAGGGRAMMEAARRAALNARQANGSGAIALAAVTVLTSLEEEGLAETGQKGPACDQALRLARLAAASGLDWVVCSAHEIGRLRAALGPRLRLVVPGLRPEGVAAGDQKRVMTPGQAAGLGADILVVGRPITAAADPAAALSRILDEIARAGGAS
jgi:orotidine-5'-phosphate decarboxylase